MIQILIIPSWVVDFLAVAGIFLGWALKGIVMAVASEFLFKPIARKIKEKGEEWEDTHPSLLKWANHVLEGHKGLHPDSGKCDCSTQ